MNLKAFLTIFSAFILMLILGSIYAWSLFVPYLKSEYGFSTLQTQIIFGSVIGVFSLTMLFAHKFLLKFGAGKMVLISGLLYFIAYILTLLSKGNFLIMWIGIGLIGGISTGIGYLVSISVPVLWFPHKKGLITGIVSAGFGAGAILHSFIAEKLFKIDLDVIQVMAYPSIFYSFLILIISFLISSPEKQNKTEESDFSILPYLKKPDFIRLFTGILTGTFAGLIVIGNLKPIGMSSIDDEITLASGIAFLSVANFIGRLFWGWLADHAGAFFLIPFTLIFTGITVFLITFINLTPESYLFMSAAVGFGYGAHFVLYTRETAHRFGIENIGKIYPYIFLGYGLSGILGPVTGGILNDLSGNFLSSGIVSLILCLIVGAAIIFEYYLFLIKSKKKHNQDI